MVGLAKDRPTIIIIIWGTGKKEKAWSKHITESLYMQCHIGDHDKIYLNKSVESVLTISSGSSFQSVITLNEKSGIAVMMQHKI